MLESSLELIHIYGGLPWWGSVVAAGLLVRLVLLKYTLGASDTSAKLRQIKPLIDPVNKRMLQALRDGNHLQAAQSKQEIEVIKSSHNVKAWKAFIPMIQVPIGFAFFRVLRGMASLPVPGIESESFLWMTDLTVADPFYIIPVATTLLMHYTLKVR